jgi:hypothetical protein
MRGAAARRTTRSLAEALTDRGDARNPARRALVYWRPHAQNGYVDALTRRSHPPGAGLARRRPRGERDGHTLQTSARVRGRLAEPLRRVLSDRLEHPIPQLVSPLLDHHERFVGELGEEVEDVGMMNDECGMMN